MRRSRNFLGKGTIPSNGEPFDILLPGVKDFVSIESDVHLAVDVVSPVSTEARAGRALSYTGIHAFGRFRDSLMA